MKQKYIKFIKELIEEDRKRFLNGLELEDADIVRGCCVSYSNKMKKQFPELECVPGYCNGEEHLWNVDPDGNVVDATGIQFGNDREYVPYEENNPEHLVVIGRCQDCGDYIYGKMTDTRKSFCSESCEQSTISYLNSI